MLVDHTAHSVQFFGPNNNLAEMMTADVRKEPFQKGSTIEAESENLVWENNEEK